MPFHLEKSEPPDEGLRRVCREHIRKARICLRHCDRPGTVHTVRKEIKKLRAGLRLVQAGPGRKSSRKLIKKLGRASARLAVSRDAQVTLAAFQKLAGRAAARRFPHVQGALRTMCRRKTRRFSSDDSVAETGRILWKAGRRLAGLKVKQAGWKAFEPGLRQSYRRGRLALRRVQQRPSPENLHAWRKPVQNFRYQLRMLCPVWSASSRVMLKTLDRLGQLLGDDHDLFLLRQFILSDDAGCPEEKTALTRLVNARRKQLRAAALKSGIRVYTETPSVISRRLAKGWNRWRG